MKDRAKTIAFIGITYFLTMLFHFILQIKGGHSNPVSLDLLGIPMLFPFIAVIILQKSCLKESLKSYIDLSLKHNRWLLYTLIIPVLMSLLLNMVGIILFKNEVIGISEALKILGINIVVGISIASISAFFEEVGWRGFLYTELKELGIIKSALLTGIAWAVWHIPVAVWYKYVDNPLQGAIINTLQLVILSLIISYIRYKSGSVIAATLMHGMLNTLFLSPSTIFFTATNVFHIEWVRILIGIVILLSILLYEYNKQRRENSPGPLSQPSNDARY